MRVGYKVLLLARMFIASFANKRTQVASDSIYASGRQELLAAYGSMPGYSLDAFASTPPLPAGRLSQKPCPTGMPIAKELRAAIPANCFVKSLWKSMFYLVRDMTLMVGAMYLITRVIRSDAWVGADDYFVADAENATSLEMALRNVAAWPIKIAVTALHWAFTGFLMWCVFVVGHDCGHTTFSDFPVVNDILGHLTHGSILVPYWPWARSHRLHHQFHNNGPKDMSHWWFHRDLRELQESQMAKFAGGPLRVALPVIGWITYIVFAEGGHFTPFGGPCAALRSVTSRRCKCLSVSRVPVHSTHCFRLGALWKGASLVERIKCLVSGAVVVANAFLVCWLLVCTFASRVVVPNTVAAQPHPVDIALRAELRSMDDLPRLRRAVVRVFLVVVHCHLPAAPS